MLASIAACTSEAVVVPQVAQNILCAGFKLSCVCIASYTHLAEGYSISVDWEEIEVTLFDKFSIKDSNIHQTIKIRHFLHFLYIFVEI